jgi:hypothetical protein
MRVIKMNLVLATWLLVSAFLFTRTPGTLALAVVAALVVAVASMASGGRPGIRYLNAVAGAVLAVVAILHADMSGIARINDLLVGGLVFLMALVSPRHHDADVETAATARA